MSLSVYEINLSPLGENDDSFRVESYDVTALLPMKLERSYSFSTTPLHCNVVEELFVSKSSAGALDKSKQQIFQTKMRVLMKNPVIFNEFQHRLAENDAKIDAKEGLTVLLYRFLDEDLRIPEVHDELIHAQKRFVKQWVSYFTLLDSVLWWTAK